MSPGKKGQIFKKYIIYLNYLIIFNLHTQQIKVVHKRIIRIKVEHMTNWLRMSEAQFLWDYQILTGDRLPD